MENMEKLTIPELWERILATLKENKEPYKGLEATVEIHLTDEPDGIYQLTFTDNNVAMYHGQRDEAKCTLKMKTKQFKKFLTGEMNSTTAFMSGKLKIDGNIGSALKFDSMMKQYNFFA